LFAESFHEILAYINSHLTASDFYFFLKIIVIPFLIVSLIIIIFSLLVGRYFFDKIDHEKKELEDTINDFLTGLIFSDQNSQEIKNNINEFKKGAIYHHKWCQHVILDKLIHIKENIKDINNNLILIIYRQFDLHLYSKKLINQRKWYFKSLGFYHYRALDYKIKKGSIKPFLNSKNRYLKSNALVSIISLSDEKFDILNQYSDKISAADEIKILDLIYEKKSTIPLTIFDWLQNKNSSIVVLAIKLIIRYRETLTLKQIKYLLESEDILVRKSTIQAIRELYIVQANDLLISHYTKELNHQNKISILKTLSVIGNEKTATFATKLLKSETRLDLKFQLVKCIQKIDFDFLNDFKTNDYEEKDLVNRMILHTKDPYLN
jgi:hypothetical protein